MAHRDLVALEAELACADTALAPSSLDTLSSSMSKVLADMKSGGIIPSDVVAQAEKQMMTLMDGINAVAAAVAESKVPAAAVSAAPQTANAVDVGLAGSDATSEAVPKHLRVTKHYPEGAVFAITGDDMEDTAQAEAAQQQV